MNPKCSNCGTVYCRDRIGTVCIEVCGGRGMIEYSSINGPWEPPEELTSDLVERGFHDSTYYNDVCASYSIAPYPEDQDFGLQVFIDAEDIDDREIPSFRFGIVDFDQEDILATDSWSEVLKTIDDWLLAADRQWYVEYVGYDPMRGDTEMTAADLRQLISEYRQALKEANQ